MIMISTIKYYTIYNAPCTAAYKLIHYTEQCIVYCIIFVIVLIIITKRSVL